MGRDDRPNASPWSVALCREIHITLKLDPDPSF